MGGAAEREGGVTTEVIQIYLIAKWKWLFFCLSACVFLLSGRSLFQSWSTNRQALAAVHFCNSSTRGSAFTAEEINDAWFQAIKANCTGDTATKQAALQEALTIAPRYLEMVHAVAPDDIILAQFAVEQYPIEPQALFWLADLMVEKGDAGEAIDAYERGLVNDERNGLMWVRLGRQYEEKGDWEAAVNAYDQGCRYVDQGKNGCPAAGRLYMAHNQYELAAERYRESINQLPYWRPAKHGLVEALLALGRTDEALPYLRELAVAGDADAQQRLDELQVTP